MLDGMGDIDWSALEHAYGDAATIPDGIRELATGANVVEWLANSINHQGSVYTATAAAVPFLVEVLEQLDDPDPAAPTGYGADTKLDLLTLLRGIGSASGPGPRHRAIMRRITQDFDEDEYARQVEREWEVVRAVRSAMAALDDRLLVVFDTSASRAVRSGATLVLATCRASADRLVPRLVRRLTDEEDPELRAGLLAAIAELADGLDPDASAAVASRLAAAAADDPSALVRTVGVQGYRRLRDDGSAVFDPGQVAADAAEAAAAWDQIPWRLEDGWRDRRSMLPARSDQVRIVGALLRRGATDSMIDANALHATWRDVGPGLIDDVAALGASGDQRLAWMAATAVGEWGAGGAVAVDALAHLVRDGSPGDRLVGPAAVRGLCRFEDARCLPVLRERLAHGDVRTLLAALPALGPFGAELLPDIVPLCHGADPVPPDAAPAGEVAGWYLESMRREALNFIGRCGPASAGLVDDLVRELDGPCSHEAWQALMALGPAGSSLLATIGSWLDARPDGLEPVLALTWLRLGGDPERIVPLVPEVIEHRVYGHQVAAALGPLAIEALPHLRARLAAADHPSRHDARAVWRITGEVDEYVRLLVRDTERAADAVDCVVSLEAVGPGALAAQERLHELVDGVRRPFAPEAGSFATNDLVWDDEALVASGRRTLAALAT